MLEGWIGDDYLIFFDPSDEAPLATDQYRMDDALPGFSVVGLRGWDDLIVVDESGATHTTPSVPIGPEWLAEYELPTPDALEPDARFTGRIKWYVKPLEFGGSPSDDENIAWITHAEHRELVRFWNNTYRHLERDGA